MTLSAINVVCGKSVDASIPHYDGTFNFLEDVEAQTIGNLLPDDNDLLSGMFDELGYIPQLTNGDDVEEFDLFRSRGGMELVVDDGTETFINVVGGSINGQLSGVNGSNTGEQPHGEHPSRTLLVRNINSNVEASELISLFEQYGDVQALCTPCKHIGFIMISCCDIRAERNAMRALQNRPLRVRKLHFSIPKSNTQFCVFDRGKQNENEDKVGNIESGWYQKEFDLRAIIEVQVKPYSTSSYLVFHCLGIKSYS